MILVFKTSSDQQLESAHEQLDSLSLKYQRVPSARGCITIILSDVSAIGNHVFSKLPGIEKVVRTEPQCSIAIRDGLPSVQISPTVSIGGGKPVVIAGPCSVEGLAHVLHSAKAVKEAGAHMLRGGAFKPRTSPYDFQGLGKEGLEYLAEARKVTGLPVVSEVMSASQITLAEPYIDVFQIGARNMYNYDLLREVGRTRKPVLLKRAMSATIQELLNAAEYIMLEGNLKVILCERGIRTFETHTRNTLDLSAVAALKTMTPLPVLVDPSHGSGRPELIRPLSRAAIACGADGLIIEVHENPSQALSDGEQAISSAMLKDIIADAKTIYDALNYNQTFTRPIEALSANRA